MGALTASLFVSLDGYATDTEETMYWVTDDHRPEKAEFDYVLHAAADILTMGRITYQQMSGYWPVADPDDPLTRVMNGKRKVVFTDSLTGRSGWRNTSFRAGDLAAGIEVLKQEGELLVCGSVTLVRSMMRLGVLDRLILQVHPVVLGVDGGRLVFDGHALSHFELNATRTLDGQVVVLDYSPSRSVTAAHEGQHATRIVSRGLFPAWRSS